MSDDEEDLEALRQAALSSLMRKKQLPLQKTNAVFYRPMSNSNLISIQPVNSHDHFRPIDEDEEHNPEDPESDGESQSSSGSEYQVIEEGLSVSSGDVDEVIEEVVVSDEDSGDDEEGGSGSPSQSLAQNVADDQQEEEVEDAISIATHDSFDEILNSLEEEIQSTKKAAAEAQAATRRKRIDSSDNNGRDHQNLKRKSPPKPKPLSSTFRDRDRGDQGQRNRSRSPPIRNRRPRSPLLTSRGLGSGQPRRRLSSPLYNHNNRRSRTRSPLRDNRRYRSRSRSPVGAESSSRRYRSRSPVENRIPHTQQHAHSRIFRNSRSRSPPPRRRYENNSSNIERRRQIQNIRRSRSRSPGGAGATRGSQRSQPSSRSISPTPASQSDKRHKLSFGDHRLRQRLGTTASRRDGTRSRSSSKPHSRPSTPNPVPERETAKNLSREEREILEKRRLKFQSANNRGKLAGKVVLSSTSKELPKSNITNPEKKETSSSKPSIASRLGKVVNNEHENPVKKEVNRQSSSSTGKDIDLRTKLQQKRAANVGRIFSVVLKDTLSGKSGSGDSTSPIKTIRMKTQTQRQPKLSLTIG